MLQSYESLQVEKFKRAKENLKYKEQDEWMRKQHNQINEQRWKQMYD